MHTEISTGIMVETIALPSEHLGRTVTVNFYQPHQTAQPAALSLLLVNDGQDLEAMGFDKMLGYLSETRQITPLLVAGIHCGEDRLNEYGMAIGPDFKGRGTKGAEYQRFILEELLPFIYGHFRISEFKERAYAGFSLGGLSAMDITWNHPEVFSKVGVFSGSLWWRSKDKDAKDYNGDKHRMMHQQVRAGEYHPGQRFFFQCGTLDETEDRNRNGVIDSIDDTIDLMRELLQKGYRDGRDMQYFQLQKGKHDVPTWAKALPTFLKWGFRGPGEE
ncbi:alpha/beta hydrolase-fold protein [Paraflavitalea sp. CAU 1676]|uniref:alpha/beta hydrolase n=1 Tax=Paraflavitalea sp. CAU 1676 TaxID=3032598 RepID=UPI0023DA3B94|nr:alpha/beta hydrolase-fold protein [Paraflavitalea sp. CAU 1676]MDF2190208.1 alpha/beta hydrolase-fold protein [Paraflavitalea sp. CAU 1676]